MDKKELIQLLDHALKSRGYRRRGFYWFLSQHGKVFCVNIQNSQWDKQDYYVNIGAAEDEQACKYPTILKWTWRHRCRGKNGQVNLSIEEILTNVDLYFSDYSNADDPSDFYSMHSADRICNQYWL